ncbi:hypothetical protein [Metabacillus iocasae]|uniref:Zn-dependent protease with chaperone function n=1 Tax=Priestia iocasae TaxID=2291674 RepID=A0ABS2QSB4_9BACI|nr:hypothetical protein [Metabacillus iocasae]MBM7702336.1 Zn-dependent protease with chaperone function [Metabacillus iocasae]
MYYFLLLLGAFFVLYAVGLLSFMTIKKIFTLRMVGQMMTSLLLGVLCLFITLPSLTYMLLKDYDVVRGTCTIEIDSSGRSAMADFHLLDTDEWFIFNDIPELDAYGKAIPYYCEVTVTKDHLFEIDYKIYDVDSKKLLATKK